MIPERERLAEVALAAYRTLDRIGKCNGDYDAFEEICVEIYEVIKAIEALNLKQ